MCPISKVFLGCCRRLLRYLCRCWPVLVASSIIQTPSMTCSDSLQGGAILRYNVYMQFTQIKVSVIILFVCTNGRFLQRCPLSFLSSAVSLTLIQCALAACSLNHRDAFTSVMKFFRDLIYLPSQQDLVSSVLSPSLLPPSSVLSPSLLPPSSVLSPSFLPPCATLTCINFRSLSL